MADRMPSTSVPRVKQPRRYLRISEASRIDSTFFFLRRASPERKRRVVVPAATSRRLHSGFASSPSRRIRNERESYQSSAIPRPSYRGERRKNSRADGRFSHSTSTENVAIAPPSRSRPVRNCPPLGNGWQRASEGNGRVANDPRDSGGISGAPAETQTIRAKRPRAFPAPAAGE